MCDGGASFNEHGLGHDGVLLCTLWFWSYPLCFWHGGRGLQGCQLTTRSDINISVCANTHRDFDLACVFLFVLVLTIILLGFVALIANLCLRLVEEPAGHPRFCQ